MIFFWKINVAATSPKGTQESTKKPAPSNTNTMARIADAANRSPLTRKSRLHFGQTVYTNETLLNVVLFSGRGMAGIVVLASSSEISLRQCGQRICVLNMPNA